MKINIFGSTGIIGSKTLDLINNYFPNIRVNLLCANNNINKLSLQINKYKPKYVYINNSSLVRDLISKTNSKTIILNYSDLKEYLINNNVNYSLLAISGYQSLKYFEMILKNSESIGLVSKEAIVSAGHLFNKFSISKFKKIYPIDSEHFSIFKFINNKEYKNNIEKITLTASGGPFLGYKYTDLKNISFKKASKHPKWKMGYKNSIDSATLSNKCLELIEAHYLFNIPFEKLDVLIHPESKIHSIFHLKNYLYNMILFNNDMKIPLLHFLNQDNNNNIKIDAFIYSFNEQLNFIKVKKREFPIYYFFKNMNKNPNNLIKFNVANEYAVNLFKNKIIKYTDIYKFIVKITSLNLNYKLNNINDIINYHELLEEKINEKIKNIL